MTSIQITHVGFADESCWNQKRFRSVSLVSLPLEHLTSFNNELKELLRKSDVKEFKWKKLDGAKERRAALELCEFTVEKAVRGLLRVDVLIWDIEDSRHKVVGRDDIANLQRMYYHLFRNVMRMRWPNDASWRLHPDEHTSLDWETVQDCLESVSRRWEPNQSLLTEGGFKIRLRKDFSIQEILPVVSNEYPLLQLGDLFAGLAVFSREKYVEYDQWLKSTSNQPSLFNEQTKAERLSHTTRERFEVLKRLDELCKQHNLSVSLRSTRGLRTFDPEKPINFWMYEPQHPEDKAPVRK